MSEIRVVRIIDSGRVRIIDSGRVRFIDFCMKKTLAPAQITCKVNLQMKARNERDRNDSKNGLPIFKKKQDVLKRNILGKEVEPYVKIL